MSYTNDTWGCETRYPSGAEELERRTFWIESRRELKEGASRFKKIPTDPSTGRNLRGFTLDRSLWKTYNASRAILGHSPHVEDHGFVLTENDPYAGIDTDNCIDRDTGEVMPWATRMMDRLDSFSYRTVGGSGLRIIVRGRIDGGYYNYEDPETGDTHRLEAYSTGRYFTYLRDRASILNNAPIREGQPFLDSLIKVEESKIIYPKYGRREVDLPKDLERQRQEVKAMLFGNDCPPYPVLEGSRSNTLLSYGRKVFRNESMSEDELEFFVNRVNSTMLYDASGNDLYPLDEGEIDHIVYEILHEAPSKAPEEAQRRLGKVNEFLNLIYVPLCYKFDGQWKVLKSLCKHGLKYSSPLGINRVKVYMAWTTLSDRARIGSHDTLRKALDKLVYRGMITKGHDENHASGYFVLHIDEILDLGNWNLSASIKRMNYPFASYLKDFLELHYQGSLGNRSNALTLLSHYYGSPNSLEEAHLRGDADDLDLTFVMDSLLKTSWYRGVGPSNQKYILALILCGGRATVSTISDMRGVSRSTVSTALKSLMMEQGTEGRILRQDKNTKEYCLPKDLFENVDRFMGERGHKRRDFEAKKKTQAQRALHKYYKDLKLRIFELLKAGYEENEALREAKLRITLPARVPNARVQKTEVGALRNALEQLKKAEGVHVGGPRTRQHFRGSTSDVRNGENRSEKYRPGRSRGDEMAQELMFLVA